MVKSIAIVVGHEERYQGAYSPFLSAQEWGWHKDKIVSGIQGACIFWRPERRKGFGYVSQMRQLAKETAGYDLVAELHFNASEDHTANGAEVLHWVSNKDAKMYGQMYLDILTGEMPELRDRGLRAIYNRGQRGYHFIQKMKGTALILEPFFGDNVKDSERFYFDKYVDCLNRWICKLKETP